MERGQCLANIINSPSLEKIKLEKYHRDMGGEGKTFKRFREVKIR